MHPAYYAGFFDADGAVMIHRCRRSFNLTVRINQTSREILDSFLLNYGGKVQGPYERGGNAKPQWFWSCDAAKAEAFLRDVLPYLVVKRERAQHAIEYRALFKDGNILPRGRGKNPEKEAHVLSLRAVGYEKMKSLNARGVAHA